MSRYLLPTICLSLLLSFCISQISHANFQWYNDLDEALETGKQQNKPVVAYFYEPQGHQRDKKVWYSSVVERYGQHFIGAAISIVLKPEIAGEYGTTNYPTVLFFDSKGREIFTQRIEAKELMRTQLVARFKRVLTKIEEFNLVENQLELTKDNPKLLLIYAKGLRDRANFDEAEKQYNKILDLDNVSSEIVEEVEQELVYLIFLRASRDFYHGNYDRCIDRLMRFIEKHDNSDFTYQAKFMLGIALYEAGEEKRGLDQLKRLERDSEAGVFQTKAKMFIREKTNKK